MLDKVATTAASQASHDIVSQSRWYCFGCVAASSLGTMVGVDSSLGSSADVALSPDVTIATTFWIGCSVSESQLFLVTYGILMGLDPPLVYS